MDYQTYIKPELLVLIPALYIMGKMLKGAEEVSDKHIPLILGATGIFLAVLWCISTDGFSGLGVFTGLTQGVLCAGAAVYTHQLIKQARKVR